MRAVVVAVAALTSLPAQAQYYGMSGYGFNNPISASIDTMLYTGLQSRLTYRTMLKRRGYTDAQLGPMSTDEMLRILKGGAAGSAAAPAPVPRPAEKPAAGPPASRFAPSGQRLLFPALAASLGQTAEQKAALGQVFEAGLAAYEKEAATEGLVNDVAGASAFFIGTAYFVAHEGAEPDDKGLTVAARQLQVLFETPEMRKQPDAEKQKFYELLIGMATWLGTSWEVARQEKDARTMRTLRDAARDALKGYLKVDPKKLRITENGLEVGR